MGIKYVFSCILIFFLVFISKHVVTAISVCGGDHRVNCYVQDKNLTGVLSLNNFSDNQESEIKKLNLCRNKITGIDKDLWQWLGRVLITLNLSFNKIGKFPTSTINNLTLLESLNLSSNQVSELEISDISELQNLKYFDVSLNNMQVNMSDKGFNNLNHLNLAGNNLTWKDLENLGKILKLTYLNISDSKLSGKKPTDISNISKLINLTHLDLSKNNFSEIDFEGFKDLSNLVFLDISDAGLHESVSLKEFLNLGNLTKLILSRNNYDSLDDLSSVANTSKLEYLNLSGNNLTGSTPFTEILVNLSKLSVLDLSNNSLNGPTIFAEMLKLENLTKLDLSSNNLGTQEESSSKALVSSILQYLDLSSNNLTGPILTEILDLEKLTFLNLSHNSLSGEISNLTRLPHLKVLDLSYNNLTGNISDLLKEKMEEMGKGNVDISNNSICVGNDSFLKSIGGLTCSDDEPKPTKKKDSSNWKIALGVTLPIFIIALAIIFLVMARRRRRKLWRPRLLQPRGTNECLSGPFTFETGTKNWSVDIKLATSVPVVIIDKPFARYTFADLFEATSGFDRDTLVDEERFGLVYIGKLPDGHQIWIDVLDHKTRLADNNKVANYLERIGSMNHPNLAPLIGYCIIGSQKIVIYDYMENGNLHDLLQEPSDDSDPATDDEIPESRNTYAWIDENNQIHNRTYSHQGQNTWIFRHRIAVGVARGLAYLHNGHSLQIVHGNVKSRNIFLDSTFIPRLSNYGLNILENPNESMLMETVGTTECDVYDFGLLLFELVTGRNDVEWIRKLVKKNTLTSSEVIDRKIRSSGDEKQMLDSLRIGYLCTAEVASKRPSMQQVIGLLRDIEPNVVVEFAN
ncbi:hypothetical protein ZOSMA_36G00820 [Zostera marina]|uniref:Protein kinase domain-containing protein n=1 Tax=Zostera marina TaxID=29655 RepID=A0A0K9P623_ZOSMR|nr:hypothetical protein ZOSMA_36G00820 [Zostera marina]